MRKVFCFFTVIALLMCCCSCSETDSVVFNGTNVLSVNGGYIAQIDNHYYIYTDIDGSPFDFIIDPMATDKSEAEVLCSGGSKVYYVNESSEIICRDMMTYEETVFFRPSDNGGLSLLGLAVLLQTPWMTQAGIIFRPCTLIRRVTHMSYAEISCAD